MASPALSLVKHPEHQLAAIESNTTDLLERLREICVPDEIQFRQRDIELECTAIRHGIEEALQGYKNGLVSFDEAVEHLGDAFEAIETLKTRIDIAMLRINVMTGATTPGNIENLLMYVVNGAISIEDARVSIAEGMLKVSRELEKLDPTFASRGESLRTFAPNIKRGFTTTYRGVTIPGDSSAEYHPRTTHPSLFPDITIH